MMVDADLVIGGGKVYYRGSILEGGVAVQDGKIVAVAKDAGLPRGEERFDVKGRILCPGFIDPHVHLRDMNYSYKEDFRSGTLAAAAGGFTTVLDMPNTDPITDSLGRMAEKIERARANAYVNVGFYLALTKRTDFRALPLGVGLKAYLYSPREELQVDVKLVSAAAHRLPRGYPLAVHAERAQLILELHRRSADKSMSEAERFLHCHPPEAELQCVSEIIGTVPSEVMLHFSHVSLPSCTSLIGKSGRRASIEVTPHHLFLSSDDLLRLGGIALTDPPARKQSDLTGLMAALREGSVDLIGSDHAPHALREKVGESPPPGIPGLETSVPLMLSGVERGSIDIMTLLRSFTSRPAEIFGLRGRGSLEAGGTADFTVLDLKRPWTIDSSRFFSKARYSPFDGLKVRGGPWATFVGGRLIILEGEVAVQPGTGGIVSWHHP
jgi:dihydroorotase